MKWKCQYCGKEYTDVDEFAKCILKCSEAQKKKKEQEEVEKVKKEIDVISKEIQEKNETLKKLKRKLSKFQTDETIYKYNDNEVTREEFDELVKRVLRFL